MLFLDMKAGKQLANQEHQTVMESANDTFYNSGATIQMALSSNRKFQRQRSGYWMLEANGSGFGSPNWRNHGGRGGAHHRWSSWWGRKPFPLTGAQMPSRPMPRSPCWRVLSPAPCCPLPPAPHLPNVTELPQHYNLHLEQAHDFRLLLAFNSFRKRTVLKRKIAVQNKKNF